MKKLPTSELRERIFLTAVLLLVAFLTIVSLRSSMTWIGQPFLGFLLAPNRIVLETGPPHWSGARAGIPIGSRLSTVDGRAIHGVEEALTAVRAAGPGGLLLCTFSTGAGSTPVPIAVMKLSLRDYFSAFANPFFGGLAFILMGFTVAFLRPGSHDARALLLVSLSYGLDLVLRLDLFAADRFHALHAVTRALAPVAMVYLGLAFPTPRARLDAPLLRGLGLVLIVAGAAIDLALHDAHPELWFSYYSANSLLTLLGLAVTAGLFAHHYLVEAAGVGREKLRLVGVGAAVAFLFPVLATGLGEVIGRPFPEQAGTILTWVFPASLALAIVKRTAIDLDVVLRRALIYAALTAGVAIAYAAVVTTLTSFSKDVTALDSPWFTLFFSLGVLLLFRPLWELLQGTVDHLFFRTRFDFAAIVQSVSQALARSLKAEEIALHLRHVATQTFAPHSVRLYAASEPGGPLRALDAARAPLLLTEQTLHALSSGQVLAGADVALAGDRVAERGALFVPLRFEGRLEGVLLLGAKRSGATYGPRDFELLRILANQAAIALRNAAAYTRVNEVLASLESRVEERTRALQGAQAELTESNRRLRELDQLKTRFFADASHELRTPLTLVLGPLDELLHRAGQLEPGTARLVELARSNAARLLVLTDTLLDLSRLDAGRMEPTLRSENLVAIVEQTAEPFRWLAEQKRIEFRITGTEKSIPVHCDAGMIAKIVGNLLANALKFTTSGHVSLDLGADDGHAVVRMKDSGPGISAAELPVIFDRYRQASSAGAATASGSGIGLALVKELVALHSGSVEASSVVGQGSEFTVVLPLDSGTADLASPVLPVASISALAAAVGTAESTTATNESVAADSAAAHVLVVDDNPNMLEFLRHLLSESYRVRLAADATTALDAIREEKPDLIVSDVMMPGPDGIALCETIRADAAWRHIPLILLTARANLEAKVMALEAGADDYVTKPFHSDELKARIAALLRARRTERELERSHVELRQAYDQLRDAQAQLVQAEKLAALGTLVAGMAHEINNPVSFISSGLELITESVQELKSVLDRELANGRAADPGIEGLRHRIGYEERLQQLRQNAAICRDGVERASRIVTDLRTFGRPATGLKQLANLHETLDRTLRLLHGEYRDRIAVERRYGDVPLIPCDEAQIGQVFLNLLINALHAIEATGTITLRSRVEARYAVFEIEDTGRGMDEQMLTRIFDPFFTTKEVGMGTGLGLSVSRSILNAHGGEIRVRSAPGSGSVFTVRLPIDEAPAEQRSAVN